MTPCVSCKTRRIGGTYPISLIFQLDDEGDTLVLTRATRRHITEDDILHGEHIVSETGSISILIEIFTYHWTRHGS
jgi:hypothetical protein